MAGKSRIQGITIELDGETTGLEKALKDVTKNSINLQSELRDIERLLKFDPGNTEALAQKQEILSKQLENTTEKLNRLKAAQDNVEKSFQSGEIGEKQYRAFRREIEYTETSIKSLKDKLSKIDDNKAVINVKEDFSKVDKEVENASESVKELGGELTNLIAGAAAGKGLSEVIGDSLDLSKLNTKINLTFDIPEADLKTVKEGINEVTAYGIDAEEALEGIRRQFALNSNATAEFNTEIAKSAAAIASSYSGIDFIELIQETEEFSKTLDLSNEYTLGLFNSLLKVGFPPEQLDIISEYGSQLARVGYTAEEIQATFEAAAKSGTNNIDQLLDGIKEGRIKLAEFGQGLDETTTEILNNVGISTEQFQNWGKDIANGGLEGKEAMVQVAEAIKGIDDEVLKNQVGVLVYGTLWEEQGENITNTLIKANKNVIDLEGNQKLLNEGIESLDSTPAVQLENALSDLKLALEPLLITISEFIGKIATWISENPTLAATITAIVTVLGILMGIFLAISPIITAVTTLAGTLGLSIGAIAAPVLIVIGVITALIAIGVALYKNWDTVKAKCSEIWNSIKGTFSSVWEGIKTTFSNAISYVKNIVTEKFNNIKTGISEKMQSIKTTISSIWDTITSFLSGINLFNIGENIIQGLINGIKNMATNVVNSVKGVISGAIEGAKNLLGIHSPSRVFMEFGEYSGEGFINGISAMKDSVAKAGQAMADASIPTIKVPNFNRQVENYEPTPIYIVTENYLDGKLIGTHTTKKVLNNINRSTKNHKINKGSLVSV